MLARSVGCSQVKVNNLLPMVEAPVVVESEVPVPVLPESLVPVFVGAKHHRRRGAGQCIEQGRNLDQPTTAHGGVNQASHKRHHTQKHQPSAISTTLHPEKYSLSQRFAWSKHHKSKCNGMPHLGRSTGNVEILHQPAHLNSRISPIGPGLSGFHRT